MRTKPASSSQGTEPVPLLARRALLAAPVGLAAAASSQAAAKVRSSAPADAGAGRESVLNLGAYARTGFAVGDGHSKPLLSQFTDLAAAQRVFPAATALTDEADWCALQDAIDTLARAGGGTVHIPAGRYVLGDRYIQLPNSRPFGKPGVQVNLLGDGQWCSILKWQIDRGQAGTAFALGCGPEDAAYASGTGRYAADGLYEGFIADLGLEGPGAPLAGNGQDLAIGTKPCRMSGLMWGARRRLQRVTARWFYAGLDLVGDHCSFADVQVSACYYNLYLAEPSRTLWGDLAFQACKLSNAGLANIGLHPKAWLNGVFSGRCYFGGAPYHILREAGDSVESFLADCDFDGVNAEKCGNGFVHEENARKTGTITNTTFRHVFFLFDDAYRLTHDGRQREAVIDCAVMNGVRFENLDGPHNWAPAGCTRATFFVERYVSGLQIDGDVASMLRGAEAAGRPLIAGLAQGGLPSVRLRNTAGTSWDGMLSSTHVKVAVGDMVGYLFDGVGPANAGDADRPLVGVAVSGASEGGQVAIATAGRNLRANVESKDADAATNQVAVRLGLKPGTVTRAQGERGRDAIVGYAVEGNVGRRGWLLINLHHA